MCNGYRHDRERCTCGFGGEGHLGHRGGARETCIGFDPPETQRSTRWHNKPMAQLAAELGHSVIFPVACRGCGHRIYLFADPNGGFAMFDEVSPPWPKHVAIEISARQHHTIFHQLVIRRVMTCPYPWIRYSPTISPDRG